MPSFSNGMIRSCKISTDKHVALFLCNSRASCSVKLQLQLLFFSFYYSIILFIFSNSYFGANWSQRLKALLGQNSKLNIMTEYRLIISLLLCNCDCPLSIGPNYILCLKKWYHPTTNDNFNSSCPIPVIFIDRVAEEIIGLVASVCVRPFVRVCACVRLLWALSCLNRLIFDLDFWREGRSWPWLAWDCMSRS